MALHPHLPTGPTQGMIQGLRNAVRFLGPPDCHDEDQELLAVMHYLKGGNPPTERAWRVLASAAVRGDLFIVTRGAGDSLDCLARLQRGRRAA